MARIAEQGHERLGGAKNIFIFLFSGAMLNFALMVFNLIPVPPLDGSRIVACVFPPYERLLMHPQAAVFVSIALILVFLNAGTFAFGAAETVTSKTLDLVLGAFGVHHR